MGVWNAIECWFLAHLVLSTTKFVQMMTLGWFWPILWQGQLVPYAFVWEKGKTVDFSETVVVFDVKVGRCSN